MSHFGRAGPPDIRDTYSLLVLNITFRTSADDLFPLFDRYGKVVDIFIPRDRRTGDSRGFAFVRYKHSDEAQKAIDRLDGRIIDGRNIVVQFAKYGRNDEEIQRGKITTTSPKHRSMSRSRSPRRIRRYRENYRERDYRRRSHSRERYDRDHYRERERDYRERDERDYKERDYRRRSRSHSRGHSRSRSHDRSLRERSQSRSLDRKASPIEESPRPRRGPSLSPERSPARSRSPSKSRSESLKGVDERNSNESPSHDGRRSVSQDRESPSPSLAPRSPSSVSPLHRSASLNGHSPAADEGANDDDLEE
ncbi:hypothetical protein O6H91_08G111400 [Diphasiastrum complanatum]|uniref:Uncharacterized protein n=1 Tax=Diphasiastrum complanatum TaxID=34168 RepID=A0ACC2D100_DIPCM|nr:hypothetical protein O6H91_08G111400 [Diphasiastrum complanatum]